MFGKELNNVFVFQDNKGTHLIFEASKILVGDYKKNYTVRKVDDLIYSLTNILGLLFIRYKENNFSNWGPGCRRKSATIVLPSNHALFSESECARKEVYQQKKYKIARNNLKTFKIGSWKRLDTIIEILLINNICTRTVGSYNGDSSTLILNEPSEWIGRLASNDTVFNLKLYNCLNGDYFDSLVYKTKKEKKLDVSVNHTSYEYELEEDKKIVRQINSLFPKELKESYQYRRIYKYNPLSGGRFYSLFTNMPKTLRKVLIEEACNYREIDIQSFVPNVMSLLLTGDFFPERPYNLVAKSILKSKKQSSMKKIQYSDDFVKIFANAIKQSILILLNNIHIDDRSIRFLNEDSAIQKNLIRYGLQNTEEEKREASKLYKNISNDKQMYSEKYSFLYDNRKIRWEKETKSNFDCPNFYVTPKNVQDAMRRSLKSINGFILTSNWAWTQFLESELLVYISEDLEKDKLLPLFVHDAFYVPSKYEDKYRELAQEHLVEIVKYFKEAILTDKNKEEVRYLFSKRVKKYFSYSMRSRLIKREKNNTIKEKDYREVTNRIIKSMKLNSEMLKFYRGLTKKREDIEKAELCKLVFPFLVQENKTIYKLTKEIIKERVNRR